MPSVVEQARLLLKDGHISPSQFESIVTMEEAVRTKQHTPGSHRPNSNAARDTDQHQAAPAPVNHQEVGRTSGVVPSSRGRQQIQKGCLEDGLGDDDSDNSDDAGENGVCRLQRDTMFAERLMSNDVQLFRKVSEGGGGDAEERECRQLRRESRKEGLEYEQSAREKGAPKEGPAPKGGPKGESESLSVGGGHSLVAAAVQADRQRYALFKAVLHVAAVLVSVLTAVLLLKRQRRAQGVEDTGGA